VPPRKECDRVDAQLFRKLSCWARFGHPRKTRGWCCDRSWKRQGQRSNFGHRTSWLVRYADTPIRRHSKVKGDKSLYGGDWPCWVQRLGRDPTKPLRGVRLVKRDKGRCLFWGLHIMVEHGMAAHHWDANPTHNRYSNLVLLHGHCHDETHGRRCL
jgi:RNA-directed DNA polymerase